MTINLDELRKTVENAGEAWADGEHIDIVTPAVVRELIDRLEQAERELVAVKSTQVQHIVTTSFETARTAGIALDEAVKLVGGWLVDDPDRRAREAEQAVQRVREINQFLPASIMERITLALDGDTRRLADQGLGDKLACTTKNGDAS